MKHVVMLVLASACCAVAQQQCSNLVGQPVIGPITFQPGIDSNVNPAAVISPLAAGGLLENFEVAVGGTVLLGFEFAVPQPPPGYPAVVIPNWTLTISACDEVNQRITFKGSPDIGRVGASFVLGYTVGSEPQPPWAGVSTSTLASPNVTFWVCGWQSDGTCIWDYAFIGQGGSAYVEVDGSLCYVVINTVSNGPEWSNIYGVPANRPQLSTGLSSGTKEIMRGLTRKAMDKMPKPKVIGGSEDLVQIIGGSDAEE